MKWTSPLVLQMINGDNELNVFLEIKNGEFLTAKLANKLDLDTADYIISASSDTWQKILNKELDPMLAMMTKRLELKKGNISTLLKYVEAAKSLLKFASQIPTEF